MLIPMTTNAQLKIAIPNLDKNLNNLNVNSVSEYVVLDDLLRPLIKFDSNGELEPDLVESWEIKDSFKTYVLKLKKDQFFSDGSPITLKDVLTTFNNLIKKESIVHGDANKIKKITSVGKDAFQIELLESDPFFLTQLSSPEYRIVKSDKKNFNITSGPYYIASSKKDEIVLKLNNSYPFPFEVKHTDIIYHSYRNKNFFKNSSIQDFDLIWPDSSFTQEEINHFKTSGFKQYFLNLGFSYWLSLNPNTLSLVERKMIRKRLDNQLKASDFFEKNNLERAQQLFLPLGPGRLSEAEIEELKIPKTSTDMKLKKLSLLLPKNIQEQLLNELKKSFLEFEISYYKDFTEYSSKIKNHIYDIILVNNDLSSIDLRSSIMVTFNPSRPLVWLSHSDKAIENNINKIKVETNSTKRYEYIKKLSSSVLEDVLVYPLYYDYGYFFAKEKLDLSNLNKAGAETFSWKIK